MDILDQFENLTSFTATFKTNEFDLNVLEDNIKKHHEIRYMKPSHEGFPLFSFKIPKNRKTFHTVQVHKLGSVRFIGLKSKSEVFEIIEYLDKKNIIQKENFDCANVILHCLRLSYETSYVSSNLKSLFDFIKSKVADSNNMTFEFNIVRYRKDDNTIVEIYTNDSDLINFVITIDANGKYQEMYNYINQILSDYNEQKN